jgi:hypothetical protein
MADETRDQLLREMLAELAGDCAAPLDVLDRLGLRCVGWHHYDPNGPSVPLFVFDALGAIDLAQSV